jgi:tight adherence protein B
MVNQWLARITVMRTVQLLLAQAGMRWMADQFLLMMILIGLAAGLVLRALSVPMGVSILVVLFVMTLPLQVALYKKRRRRRLFDQQLPDFLEAVARAMQAGNAFSGAVAAVSKESPDPISTEFRLVFDQINFGSSMKEGLTALALRTESQDVHFFVTAVLVHQQTGGSLTTLLLSLSALIRDRQRLRKQGRVLSAEGRLSAWILGLLPIVTGAMMYVVNPEFVSVLWTHPTGVMLLQGVLAAMTVGIFWMWRVINFRI